MKSLLILAALAGLVYFFFLSGSEQHEEQPEVIYQQQLEKADQLEDSMQEALDQRMQSVNESSGAE